MATDAGRWHDLVLELPWVEVTEVAQRPLDATGAGPLPTLVDLRAAVVAAHAALCGGTEPPAVASLWLQAEPDGPTRVLLAGAPFEARTGADRAVGLLFPPGSRGRRVAADEVLAGLRSFSSWVGCTVRFDPSTAAAEEKEAVSLLGSREDTFAHLASRRFCWLVLAFPVEPAAVRAELQRLSMAQPAQAQLASRRLDMKRQAELDEAWFQEAERSLPAGLWDLRVAVGAESGAVARQAASLLANARDLVSLPFALEPGPAGDSLAGALQGRDGGPSRAAAGPELVAALARPPLRELPGLRVVQLPAFDVTPEHQDGLELGRVVDQALVPRGPFSVTLDTLNRHAFICGATGSGKSQTARVLLERLTAAGVPWLVVEPAKAEHRTMAARLGDGAGVIVIRPGDPEQPAVSLNPLAPAWLRRPDGALRTFELQTHLDLVRALFVAAFQSQEPFPQILGAALERCYRDLGWDPSLGEPAARRPGAAPATPRYPGLGDLQRAARQVVDEAGYGREVRQDVRGFVDVRLQSLRLGATGRFFEGGHPLDMGRLLRHRVVLELEAIGDDREQAFFIGTVLLRMVEHLRLAGPAAGLRHVTVLEEAHRLLRRTSEGPAAHAVEQFADVLAEVRAYGEGVVIAEQIPAKIIEDAVKNSALKVMHRLPAADDRAVVGATMNLDERQSAFVVSLRPGVAAAFADGMDRPLLVAVDGSGEARERELTPAMVREAGERARGLISDEEHPHGGAPCGRRCRRPAPCPLRMLAHSRVLAGREPALAPWVELTVAAHACGAALPPAAAPFLARLRELAAPDADAFACGVGQLVAAAIDRRYPALAEWYAAESLAGHVTDALLAQVGGATPCPVEHRWRGGELRFDDVVQALRALPPERPVRVRPEWRERGLRLTGTTAGQLLAEARSQTASRWPARAVVAGVDGLGIDERTAGSGCLRAVPVAVLRFLT